MNYKEKYEKALKWAQQVIDGKKGFVISEAEETIFPELKKSKDERMIREIKTYIKEQGDKPTGLPSGSASVHDMLVWLEKQSHVEIQPIFEIGDVMRTKEETANGFIDGMPIVVSIDEEYYHCNNESIPIKRQYEYEYPPINKKEKTIEWSEEDRTILNRIIKGYNSRFQKLCEDKYGHKEIIDDLKCDCREEWNWLKSLEQKVGIK